MAGRILRQPWLLALTTRENPVKLARFRTADDRRSFGVVLGDQVVCLDHRVADFETLLTDPAAAAVAPGDPRVPVAEVRWEPPIGEHAKVFCVGFNYATHAAESEREVPTHPTLFTRYPDSFVGDGQAVVRPYDSDSLDWEGEAALVIGAPARRVEPAKAARYIAGHTCVAENSVREWQLHSGQATAGKNWFASGACGPWLVTRDEVGDGPLTVTTRLNDVVVQQDSTDHLTFSFAEIVAYVSTFTELRPGDVIATGTPAGIGHRRNPPRYLRPGDVLEVEVSRVGTLRHTVADEEETR
jgi:2-keto-4-pentenoate hydratase/2-oxohepta-3-ene-1,7-dioic acid hydratase in catechol pathway